MIVDKSSDEQRTIDLPCSLQTSSSCFNIVEPQNIWRNKEHVARISVRGLFIYAQGHMGEHVKRDILNTTYQHCLYQWKLRDIKSGTVRRPLNETILTELLTRMTYTMGGRPIDVDTIRLSKYAITVAIFAGTVAVIGTVISLWAAFH